MSTINQIKAPIAKEMVDFEQKFRLSMKTTVPLLDKITHFIVKRKGKQIRPMFVFLSAKLAGEISESTYNAASLIELLHTATLVHDDVVDDAYERRGFFSLNALWKNKIAVLVGDFLLSRGLLLAVDNGEYRLLQLVSNAVREMSEGELLQIEKTRKLNIDESVYFEIIRQKTATLIAACCASGVASVTNDEELIQKAHQFGEKTGIAFQIKDDLFDYGEGENIGKPTGIDIKEKKTTLPLIYALNNASDSERKRIIRKVKNHKEDPKIIQEVVDYVLASGGIEYAHDVMMRYKDEALAVLNEFPESPARNSLRDLVEFTVNRKK
ncbi:MAG: polyprenyl synthetase [Crocinitomicaceae bacterium]|nr:polyprenyl synthetase [Crocinitomicaceae bacterium]|tara:strand:+ start:21090 stop:22064 length:975 start_codon:yes stop_codon:yes gene_type:complete